LTKDHDSRVSSLCCSEHELKSSRTKSERLSDLIKQPIAGEVTGRSGNKGTEAGYMQWPRDKDAASPRKSAHLFVENRGPTQQVDLLVQD
jgi:hypothetical protein